MTDRPASPSKPTAAKPPIIPAATVVIFRNGSVGTPPQLLMVTRSATMSFAGGAAVFPGGRIDPADHELAAQLDHGLDPDEAAARIAAMRETLEETGLAIALTAPVSADEAARARAMLLEATALAPVLAHFGWTLDLAKLVPFARWLPDLPHSRVFDTRFYLADLGTGAVDITVDDTENTHLFWISASGALAKADSGQIQVIYPTRRNLERLAQFTSFADARAHADAIPSETITPWVVDAPDGTRWLHIPDHLGYPVTREAFENIARG